MRKLEYYFLVKLARDAEIDSANLEGKKQLHHLCRISFKVILGEQWRNHLYFWSMELKSFVIPRYVDAGFIVATKVSSKTRNWKEIQSVKFFHKKTSWLWKSVKGYLFLFALFLEVFSLTFKSERIKTTDVLHPISSCSGRTATLKTAHCV